MSLQDLYPGSTRLFWVRIFNGHSMSLVKVYENNTIGDILYSYCTYNMMDFTNHALFDKRNQQYDVLSSADILRNMQDLYIYRRIG